MLCTDDAAACSECERTTATSANLSWLSSELPLPDTLQQELETALNGAYAIERELGGGGMSRVFLASEQALRRQVVIKVLAPELARGVSADRFRLEIQVAASLHHPHIVPLLAAGEAAGHLYYTMPFVDGRVAPRPARARGRAARLRGRARPRATSLARSPTRTDRASSTATSSRRTCCSRSGEAQVADFGIAKALSARRSRGPLTSAGLALGTPVYMAPEQAMADPTTDHRADLYALGVLGYEMLAGQPPFTGRTPQQLIAAHATETPVPLEQRRADLPAGLASADHAPAAEAPGGPAAERGRGARRARGRRDPGGRHRHRDGAPSPSAAAAGSPPAASSPPRWCSRSPGSAPARGT